MEEEEKGLGSWATNREIYDYLRTKYSGSKEYIIVGEECYSVSERKEPEVWLILGGRIRDFIIKEYEIYTTYRTDYKRSGDLIFSQFPDFEVIGVNFGQGIRENKTMTVFIKYGEAGDFWWVARNIADFLDPNFETSYPARIRDKRLETVTNKINQTLDLLGKLLEEQERLQKKKREDN